MSDRKWYAWKPGERRLGWHIVGRDGVIGRSYGDGRHVTVGAKLDAGGIHERLELKPLVCKYGMHASPSLEGVSECWYRGRRAVLCLVLLEGDITRRDREGDYSAHKMAGRSQTVLFTYDWGSVLRLKKKRNWNWYQTEQHILGKFFNRK